MKGYQRRQLCNLGIARCRDRIYVYRYLLIIVFLTVNNILAQNMEAVIKTSDVDRK